jgi:hypothetical protein
MLNGRYKRRGSGQTLPIIGITFCITKARNRTSVLRISHNEIDISKGLCSAMARQMKLTGRQFEECVDCDLTADGYIKLLIAAKELSEPPSDQKLRK